VLADGDVAAIVVDSDSRLLEIYDECWDGPDSLEQKTGTPLIQARIDRSAQHQLILALGGVPKVK
jgi:hypothetical protein